MFFNPFCKSVRNFVSSTSADNVNPSVFWPFHCFKRRQISVATLWNCQRFPTTYTKCSNWTTTAIAHDHVFLRHLKTNASKHSLNSFCEAPFFSSNLQENTKELPLSKEFANFSTGLLQLPFVENPKDLAVLAQKTVNAAEKLLQQLTNPAEPSSHEVVQILDAISNVLCKVGDAAELLRNVHPNEEWRRIATQVIDEITLFMGRANVDKRLYELLQTLRMENKNDALTSLNHEEKTVLENMRVSMEQQGVTMEEREKETYLSLVSLEGQLAYQISQFPSNPEEGVWIDRSLLLESGISMSNFLTSEYQNTMYSFNPFKNKKLYVPADSSLGHLALQFIKDPFIRRDLYELQQKSSPNMEKQMVELLNYRQNLAYYRGYENWNAFAQREGILRSPTAVKEFLSYLLESLMNGLHSEFLLLQNHKENLGFKNEGLQPWDLSYLKTSYRQETFGPCLEALQKYLSIDTVLKGMQRIISALFGLSFEREIPKKGETWHWSVLKYNLIEAMPTIGERKQRHVRGILYIDLWNRPEKTPLMAQYTIRCSKRMDFCFDHHWLKDTPLNVSGVQRNTSCEYWQIPVTALVGNFLPPPSMDTCFNTNNGKESDSFLESLLKNTTLSPSDVLMFFHEMGHILHSLISTTEFQHLSGTRGAVDFAEFPSHLFEHFFQNFSYLSASLLPSPSPNLICCIKNYLNFQKRFSHLDTLHLLIQAELDQAFHAFSPVVERSTYLNPLYTTESVTSHIKTWFSTSSFLNQSFSSIPSALPLYELMGIPPFSKFTHLLHYGGTYYAYLYCKVSSSFVWEKAFQRSCWNTLAGQELRKVLEKGCLDCTIRQLLHLVKACYHLNVTEDIIKFSDIMEFPQKIPLEPFLYDIRWKE